ncbi:MAG: translation initiation factor IF-5A [Candidatus Aenigmarchaeota archaeon]|nr:translation initiation factor IF-5A [Candidatus Aenigmarchaeota archaeon]
MEEGETKITEIKKCNPGSFVIIENEPSTVVDLKISKTGKHGDAKARLEAIGIFDAQKRVIVKPADEQIKVPIIEKVNAQVLSISGDYAQVMDMSNFSTYEVKIPEEFKEKIKEGDEVLIWKFGKKMIIKSLK